MPVTAWDGDSSYIKGGTDDTQIGNTGNKLLTQPNGDLMGSYQPDPSDAVATVNGAKMQFDASNRLEVHFAGSDEGGFRDDFSGVAFLPEWTASASGTGASTSVSAGRANIVSGTASGATAQIVRAGDYLPYTLQMYGRISQRIANQTAKIGFADNLANPNKQAMVVFDGTVNTTVKFRTGWSSAAADIQETTVTLPAGATTANDQQYLISLSPNIATLAINEVVVAQHKLHIPGPYDIMDCGGYIANSAIVTTTTLSFDTFYLNNWDRFQVDNDFIGEALLTKTYVDANTSYSSINRTELSQLAYQGNAFTIVSNTLLANTAETRLVYLVNSSVNAKLLYLSNILLSVDVSSANWCNFQIYYNPTVTANGTALTISNLRAGSATTSVMTAFSGPTVTANGTRVFFFPYNNSNQSGAVVPYSCNPYIIVPPGNSLLITGTAKANNTPIIVDLNWFEAT